MIWGYIVVGGALVMILGMIYDRLVAIERLLREERER